MKFESYHAESFFDEMFKSDGIPRDYANLLVQKIKSFPDGELMRRQEAAERALFHMGITFNVYGDHEGREKVLPFDIIPRIVEASEWEWIERGLKQRVYALNLFVDDIYHDQKIIKDRVRPEEPPCKHQ